MNIPVRPERATPVSEISLTDIHRQFGGGRSGCKA